MRKQDGRTASEPFVMCLDRSAWTRPLVLLSILMLVGCVDTDNTSCISSLSACAPYLNATTKPDATCCSALISVIDKDSQCLCNLLNNDVVKQLGVNVTQAMKLLVECGKNVSASQCSKSKSSPLPYFLHFFSYFFSCCLPTILLLSFFISCRLLSSGSVICATATAGGSSTGKTPTSTTPSSSGQEFSFPLFVSSIAISFP